MKYEEDIKYCVVCGGECLKYERRKIRVQTLRGTIRYYICDNCYDSAQKDSGPNGRTVRPTHTPIVYIN